MICVNPDDTECPVCNRALIELNTQRHHLIPKTFKGRKTVRIHKVCHQKIHSVFSERELVNYFHTIDKILENEEIIKFVKWVKKKPPEFYDKNDETKQRKKGRRR